jgi:hypothetical protein
MDPTPQMQLANERLKSVIGGQVLDLVMLQTEVELLRAAAAAAQTAKTEVAPEKSE